MVECCSTRASAVTSTVATDQKGNQYFRGDIHDVQGIVRTGARGPGVTAIRRPKDSKCNLPEKIDAGPEAKVPLEGGMPGQVTPTSEVLVRHSSQQEGTQSAPVLGKEASKSTVSQNRMLKNPLEEVAVFHGTAMADNERHCTTRNLGGSGGEVIDLRMQNRKDIHKNGFAHNVCHPTGVHTGRRILAKVTDARSPSKSDSVPSIQDFHVRGKIPCHPKSLGSWDETWPVLAEEF